MRLVISVAPSEAIMDFGIIYQLKIKKFWWLDTILYFGIALLLACIICFLIFSFKISLQEKKLKETEDALTEVGTSQQKESEKQVFDYQRKIDNFATLLTNHKTPSNVFKLLEQITLPNVWFNNFGADAKSTEINLNGEAENMTALITQASIIEQNEFVEAITTLVPNLSETGRISFSLRFTLKPTVFFSTFFPSQNNVPEGG